MTQCHIEVKSIVQYSIAYFQAAESGGKCLNLQKAIRFKAIQK
ncbi:hypothetical protein KIS4809_3875 [Bacillus sp. ZZV12-4809]|nr:hypothetical protein KIS4809_3875 [Bacillus sp. ZZV12-4809]